MNHELVAALSELFEVQNELKPLQDKHDELRSIVTLLVSEAGGSADIENLASCKMTKDTVSVSYDSAKLDNLVASLLKDGDIHSAKAIIECRKESIRKGYLRITKA